MVRCNAGAPPVLLQPVDLAVGLCATAELEKISGDVIHFSVDGVRGHCELCCGHSCDEAPPVPVVLPLQDVVYVDLAPATKVGGPFGSQVAILHRLWTSIALKGW